LREASGMTAPLRPALLKSKPRKSSLGAGTHFPGGALRAASVQPAEANGHHRGKANLTAKSGGAGTINSMITVTSSAATKVKELLEAEGEAGMALRIAVRPGGCSGYSYEMFFDGDKNDTDSVLQQEGITVTIDSDSGKLLNGATLDYSDGLNGKGFKITNPNNSRTCGCGQSFS